MTTNLIPEGTFPAVARGHQWGTAKTGTEQIAISFELLGGPAAGRQLTWYGYFTEATWERTMQSLRYAGWKGGDLADLGSLDQKVNVVIAHEADQEGRMRARIQWVNGYGASSIRLSNPMNEAQLRTFAARMKRRVEKVPEVDGERAPEESVPPPGMGAGGEEPPPIDDGPPPIEDEQWGF